MLFANLAVHAIAVNLLRNGPEGAELAEALAAALPVGAEGHSAVKIDAVIELKQERTPGSSYTPPLVRTHFIVDGGKLSLEEEEVTDGEAPRGATEAVRNAPTSPFTPPPVEFTAEQLRKGRGRRNKPGPNGHRLHGFKLITNVDEVGKTHQGHESARADEAKTVEIPPVDYHKMWAVRGNIPPGDINFASMVYVKTSHMCGANPFSQPQLKCGRVTADSVDAYGFVQDQVPQRAFGVELEMVSRRPLEAQARKMAKLGNYYRLQVNQSLGDGASMPSNLDMFPHYSRNNERNQTAIERARAKMAGEDHDLDAVYAAARDVETRRLPNMEGLVGVSACFDKAKWGRTGGECEDHTECSLSHFCRKDGTCAARKDCNTTAEFQAIDGVCPHLLGSWQWETDCTVRAFTADQARQVYPDDEEKAASEQTGVPFELVSAAPPHALAGSRGVKSVAEVLTVLNRMGVQAGPSQGMHVHVNVGKPGRHAEGQGDIDGPYGRGSDLTTEQIANVWANYAKYQLVIEEMLQDSRIGNHWAKSLRFTHQTVLTDDVRGNSNRDLGSFRQMQPEVERAKTVLKNLYDWVMEKRSGAELDDTTFCDDMTAATRHGRGTRTRNSGPCSQRYPQERYQQVNLVVLNKYGTMEFRAFPATNDAERAMQWVQFILRFVEKLKDDAGWVKDDFEATLNSLAEAQLAASFESLAKAIAPSEDAEEQAAFATSFEGYWAAKPWQTGVACGSACDEGCLADLQKTEREDLAAERELVDTPTQVVQSFGQPDSVKAAPEDAVTSPGDSSAFDESSRSSGEQVDTPTQAVQSPVRREVEVASKGV